MVNEQIPEGLRPALEEITGRPEPDVRIEPLQGDASSRAYYRLHLREGGPLRSLILMQMPPESANASEEAVGDAPPPTELPFINVQRYLARSPVRVPRIFAYYPEQGRLYLEDLGDTTLAAALAERGPGALEGLYRKAIELLVSLQGYASATPDPACVAFGRAFDHGLLLWELEHFYEWGLEGRAIHPSADQAAILRAGFTAIADRLAATPRGLVHRDYQSRNLMLVEDELVVIDFQDALQGTEVYDLVALLRDSYVAIEPPVLERLLTHYLETRQRQEGASPDPQRFRDLFYLQTVQRKLKDAGRFVYIDRVKGNPSFLGYIERSLGYVEDALGHIAESHGLQRFQEVLHRLVPELQA